MGRSIFGFIAPGEELADAAATLPDSRTAPLAEGFAFLPLAEPPQGEHDVAAYAPSIRLTPPQGEWAAEQSKRFPIAYIETDSRGRGVQAAIVWSNGTIAFGAVATPDRGADHHPERPQPAGAINQALRRLGVPRDACRDEFSALGLGRHLDNAAWLGE